MIQNIDLLGSEAFHQHPLIDCSLRPICYAEQDPELELLHNLSSTCFAQSSSWKTLIRLVLNNACEKLHDTQHSVYHATRSLPLGKQKYKFYV